MGKIYQYEGTQIIELKKWYVSENLKLHRDLVSEEKMEL